MRLASFARDASAVTWGGGRKEMVKVRKVEEAWWRGGEWARTGGGACGWSQEWREGGSGRGRLLDGWGEGERLGGRMAGGEAIVDVALANRVGQIPSRQHSSRSSVFPPTTGPL